MKIEIQPNGHYLVTQSHADGKTEWRGEGMFNTLRSAIEDIYEKS